MHKSLISDENKAKWVIYGLKRIDEDQFRYIGYTTLGASVRFNHHIDESQRKKRNYPRHWWIRKHIGGVEYKVIEECEEGLLGNIRAREAYWIKYYTDKYSKECVKPLLNLTLGGEGRTNYKFTEEQRRYLSSTWTKERRVYQAEITRQAWDDERRAKLQESNRAWSKEDRSALWTPEMRLAASMRIGKSNHVRYHINKDIFKETCKFCVDPTLQ